MNLRYLISASLCLLALNTPNAHGKTSADGAWVRATVAGQQMGGAYLTLTSDQDAQLLGAASPVAESMQLHRMSMQGEQMRMTQVPSIELPAHQPVALTGAYHLMLIGLKHALMEGTQVPIRLTIQTSSGSIETLTIQAPVKSLSHTHSH